MNRMYLSVALAVILCSYLAFGQMPDSGVCTGYPKMYNGKPCASTTRYWDGQKGACGCGSTDTSPYAWQWTKPTAAASAPIFGSGTWCGTGCGKCYKLTPTAVGASPLGRGAPALTSLVVKVTNLCPYGGNEAWCAYDVNSHGYDAHFDLMDYNMEGIVSNLGWDNPEVIYEEVDCAANGYAEWDCECASHAGPITTPTEAPAEPTEAPEDPTEAPTEAPEEPTEAPTEAPSEEASEEPAESSEEQHEEPAESSEEPVEESSEEPIAESSEEPVEESSEEPSEEPIAESSEEPTEESSEEYVEESEEPIESSEEPAEESSEAEEPVIPEQPADEPEQPAESEELVEESSEEPVEPTEAPEAPARPIPSQGATTEPGSNIQIQINGGTNAWWFGFSIVNDVTNIAKVEVRDSSDALPSWTQMAYEGNPWWNMFSINPQGKQLTAPLSLRFTSSDGEVVIAENIITSFQADTIDTGVAL